MKQNNWITATRQKCMSWRQQGRGYCPSMSLERMLQLRELVTNVMIKGFGVLLLCSVMITYTSTLVQAAVKYNQIMIPEDSDKGLRNVANLQKWRRDGI